MRNVYLYRGLGGLVILASIVYLVVDRWLMPRATRQHAVVRVPDLVGMPVEEAVELLVNQAFELGDTLELFDPDFDGTHHRQIIDQNPKPDAQAKPGRRVFLYLPRETSRDVLVPYVVGQSKRNARARIESVGLVVSAELPDTLPNHMAGPVTRAVPRAGTRLTRGDSVIVFYGTGPDPGRLVEMPDLTGLAVAEARQRLNALELSAAVLDLAEADSAAAIDARIQRQIPEAGSLVPAGTRISLFTSPPN